MKLAITAGSLMIKLRFSAPLLPVLKRKLCRGTNCILSTRNVSLFTSKLKTSSGYLDDESELHIAEEGQDDNINSLEDVFGQTHSVRNLLYPDTTDSLLVTLNTCASVQELLSVIESHKVQLKCEHVTQAILVLWDLQRVFNHFSFLNSTFGSQKLDEVNKDYLNRLNENETFLDILSFITARLKEFDLRQLSSILLYLNKMGFSVKHEMLQRLIEQFKIRLKSKSEACLLSLSQFITCTSKMGDLSYYYHVQDTVPIVFSHMNKVKTAEEFRLLTLCLNGLKHFVTDEVLSTYKLKATNLIKQEKITGKDFNTVLRMASFLNDNDWRHTSAILISKQIMLLKTNLHLLSAQDLLILFEIMHKNQEPADILNEAQRCASKLFIQLEEEAAPIDIRLKLLLCIACFASPPQRLYVEKFIRKYIDYDLSSFSLSYLHKIILFNKTADTWIYQTFWKKTLNLLRDDSFRKANLLKTCNKYITFNQDVNSYRCYAFENQALEWLEFEIKNEGIDTLILSRYSMIASFILIYGQKREILRHCIQKIEENIEQFNYIDCYNLSRSLEVGTDIVKNRLLDADEAKKIRALLDQCTLKNLRKGLGFNARNLLFKGYIYRRSSDRELLRFICDGYEEQENFSSALIKNVCFCLYSTNILLPNVLDKMVDYVIQYKEHVVAVNAERLIYLCYCLGYLPKNSQEFLQVIIDIIIRDQEKLNGLSYLHTCLSLCYFHALPQSLIQHIFNVEFLEKLDTELLGCYFKDTYPLRVRHNMFYLNRAVCLDYPECNIPWFHQKYLNNMESKRTSKSSQGVLECLAKLSESEECVTQNELTPYGYNIDFVIHLDENNKIVTPDHTVQKVGILLMPQKAYTKLNVQLKGRYQLQIRHLELLGYKVITVNLAEWIHLIYGEAKINYLRKLIWPEALNKSINR